MKVAIPTSNGKTICEFLPFCKYLLIIDTQTGEKNFIDNPMFEIVKKEKIKKRDCGENALHTGQIIPPLLKELGVSLLIARKLGEGLLDNLEVMEIEYKIVDANSLTSLEFGEFF